jgi:hypothetical protein
MRVLTWLLVCGRALLVSGTAPIAPVISKSGHVYERNLIEKYIGQYQGPDSI